MNWLRILALTGRDWRDPRWTSARAVAQGLEDETRAQRRVLMGENMIDIASKSIFGLLVDEVSRRKHLREQI